MIESPRIVRRSSADRCSSQVDLVLTSVVGVSLSPGIIDSHREGVHIVLDCFSIATFGCDCRVFADVHRSFGAEEAEDGKLPQRRAHGHSNTKTHTVIEKHARMHTDGHSNAHLWPARPHTETVTHTNALTHLCFALSSNYTDRLSAARATISKSTVLWGQFAGLENREALKKTKVLKARATHFV